MKVLSLSTMGASAAAVSIDGRVVAAIEEERLTRLKNDGGFPHEAIRACLDQAGLAMADLDEVAIYWKPWRISTRAFAVLKELVTDPAHAVVRLKRAFEALFGKSGEQSDYPELRGSWLALFRIKALLKAQHGEFAAKIRFYDHHDCHAASIYYISGFKHCICLTYDGGGETFSTVIHTIEDGKLSRLMEIGWPNSLGHYYSAFTGFLGFRMLEGEYKMMGLAPYGEPRFKDVILKHMISLAPEGRYQLNTRLLNYHAALKGQFSRELVELLGAPRKPDEEFNDHHRDIAASVQAAYEEVLLHILEWAKQQRPDLDKLCIAGGCGLNVTANGNIVNKGLFSTVLIPPAPHDAGCAIGAAFLADLALANDGSRLCMPHPYLGRSFNENQILEAFTASGLPAPLRLEKGELYETIADGLARGEIVAWFQGGSEFGPRALGNRSFLADPRNDNIREVINAKIKKRELFRPFAPSCKREVASDFFDIDQASPYMNIVARVRPEKRDAIPAVTHVDGTARVHTVEKSVNPDYWNLIDAFEKKTGVGVLLNTSFNIQEPIVESPAQAIDCFLRSEVDWLVVGQFVHSRHQDAE